MISKPLRYLSLGTLVFLGLLIGFAFWPDSYNFNPRDLLSLVYPETITPENLQTAYNQSQLRILLVPGHDHDYGGAEYHSLKEADLTLQLAAELQRVLAADRHFQVMVTRDFTTGDYLPGLADYFKNQQSAIQIFRKELRRQFVALVGLGEIKTQPSAVEHNSVNSTIADRLYGINKWANDNKFDLVLHLHFNDYRGRATGKPGPYHGFVIYLPEKQYSNARASRELGQALFASLKKHLAVSNLSGEDVGLLEDQELIAIGANGSRIGASLLVEYGYIYQPEFSDAPKRQAALAQIAQATYLGLQNYFAPAKL